MNRAIAFVLVVCAPVCAAEPLPEGAVARLETLRSAVAADLIKFTPDGRAVVAFSKGRVYVWEAASGKLRREFALAGEQVPLLAPLPDGTLFTLDLHGSAAQWHDLGSGERIAVRDLGRELKAFPQFTIGLLGWHLDPAHGSAVLVVRDWPRGSPVEQSTRFFRLDLGSGRVELTRETPGVHLVQGISPNGRVYLRTEERATLNDIAQLYQQPAGVRVFAAALETGQAQFDLRHDGALLLPKGFSPDGQSILSCTGPSAPGKECAVHQWETRSGRVRHSFRLLRTRNQEYLTFTPDGRRIVADMRDDVVRVLDARSGRELGQLAMPRIGQVVLDYRVLTCSPDGKALVTWHGDGSYLVWDLARFNPPVGKPLDRTGLEARWAALADADARPAHVAIAELIGTGATAAEFVAARLRPAAAPPAERVRQWIAELDDERFERRRSAELALVRHVEVLRDELRAAATSARGAERRRRLESILNQSPVASDPEELRSLRAVEVLEHIGSAEARRAIELLTTGIPAARLTREAHMALQRLPAN